MKISEFFINEYLTAGCTADNFVFDNCPDEFLQIAKQKLAESASDVKPCCVALTKETEEIVGAILENCTQDFHKKLLARDFITALVMEQVLSGIELEKESYEAVCQQIQAFILGNFEEVKKLHGQSFMPHQVAQLSKKYSKIELNFFLLGTSNVYIQQAINLFVSCREPYSVKIFATQPRLCTYYDQMGNLIECPHDFMRRDVNKFIEGDMGIETENQ